MILGITNDEQGRVIQRLSVSTKLAIGLPPKDGRNYPAKIDHFVFLKKPDDAKKGTEWGPDSILTEHYKSNPREVEIILLDDEIENVFPTRMAWWLKSQCKCWGNGAVATRRTEAHPEGEEHLPCGSLCTDLREGKCKPSGDLRFMLADFPRLGAVARIHTTSRRSISQIHSSLQQIQTITGGRLAGIRAKLVVRPEKTSYEEKGQMKSATIYALSLEIQAEGMRQLVDRMTETARLFEQTRKMLGTGHIEVIEDEEEVAPEIQAEFYPPEQQAELPPIAAEATPVPNVVDSDLLSGDDRLELFKLASRSNVTQGDLVIYLKQNHGIESTRKITRAAYADTRKWLESVSDHSNA